MQCKLCGMKAVPFGFAFCPECIDTQAIPFIVINANYADKTVYISSTKKVDISIFLNFYLKEGYEILLCNGGEDYCFRPLGREEYGDRC